MSFWTLNVGSVNWAVWRKRTAWSIGVAIFLAVLFAAILPRFGIFLGIGGSLEPQVSWLSISREVKLELGEMPEVGRLYTYRRPASTAKTPLARLKHRLGWRYATKWCWAVDEKSQTWATSTDDGDMPFSAIDRKVVAIWDWQWALDIKRTGGQLSWARLHAGPHDYVFSGGSLFFVREGMLWVRGRDGSEQCISIEDPDAPLALVSAIVGARASARRVDVVDIRPKAYVYPTSVGEFVLLEHRSAPTRVSFCGEGRMEGVRIGVSAVPVWAEELRVEVLPEAAEEEEGVVQGFLF